MMELRTVSDLSLTSIEQAILMIDEHAGRLRYRYTVFVNDHQMLSAARLLRDIGGMQAHNPIAPYINLDCDSTLKYGAWYVRAVHILNPRSITDCGSPGVT